MQELDKGKARRQLDSIPLQSFRLRPFDSRSPLEEGRGIVTGVTVDISAGNIFTEQDIEDEASHNSLTLTSKAQERYVPDESFSSGGRTTQSNTTSAPEGHEELIDNVLWN